MSGTIDAGEVDKFSRLAREWWNPHGKMGVLHKFNPVRLGYIRETCCTHFHKEASRVQALEGLSILDIGCGGGLLCEPLARQGADVTGIDASAINIEVARSHAAGSNLKIAYRAISAEALAEENRLFDVVLAMEVVEHVADAPLFIASCARLVKPGGLVFAATLNRTLKSFMLAIVGAEYILRWLPRGTHSYEKFITPDELEQMMKLSSLTPVQRRGVIYTPLSGQWKASSDTDVNYMVVAQKATDEGQNLKNPRPAL